MRQNKNVAADEILKLVCSQAKETVNNRNTKYMKNQQQYSKEALWKAFTACFKRIYGKKLDIDTELIENLKPIFLYFIQDPQFFNCNNLIKGNRPPSFDKGLLIIGGHGIGKTDFFKVFEELFKNDRLLKFKGYSSINLVKLFEACETPADKTFFMDDKMRRVVFVDDLSAERLASNFGKFDVVGEILAFRYERKLKTFATCNYATTDKCVATTLARLGERYGSRIYDRLFEMFNVIEFKGKSKR